MALNKKLLSLASALLLSVLAACAGQDDPGDQTTDGEPQQGGTLTWGAEQFPADLQCEKASNNLAWCYYMMDGSVLQASYGQTAEFTFEPQLLAEEVEVDEGPPFTLTYRIHPDATWSDGTPVTATDYEFTWSIYEDPDNQVISREGYDKIESAEIVDEKTITFTFKKPFVAYRTIFDRIYPAHILKGQNWNKVWDQCVCDPKTGEPIGNGPFLVTDFKKNQSITLEPNENWWGEHPPYLDKIVWVYTPDTNTEIQQLRGGEVDAIFPSWQLQLRNLENIQGVNVETKAGTFWQHLDMNFAKKPLDQLFVRQAIAYGIDREAIVDRLVRVIQPDAEPLHNVIYVSNAPNYEAHWDVYNYDPERSQQLLEDNGCTKGADGIYVCDGQKLSFAYKSTAGNELRELMFQIIQANLKDVGIEVTNAFGEADVVFADLDKRDYEIFQFGWVGDPDPFGSNGIFQCDGPQNYTGHCNREAHKLLERTNSALDPAERAALYNQADEVLAGDVPILPLWQVPQPLAYHDYVHGLVNNPTQGGPMWNAADIWIEKRGGA